jgi:hypothetical protein
VPLVVPNYDKITYTILIEFKKRKDNPSPFPRGFGGLGILGCWGFGASGFGASEFWWFGVAGFWGFGVLWFRGFVVSGFWGVAVIGLSKISTTTKKLKVYLHSNFPSDKYPRDPSTYIYIYMYKYIYIYIFIYIYINIYD